jgi:hypothetical protein
MTDAFQDVLDDTEDTNSSSDDSNEETVTDAHVAADMGVRTTLPDDGELRTSMRYEDEDTGDQADDVDPRGLFKKATLNELRHYAREGSYGPALVTKPIDDIFKHGFEIEGDNTEKDGEYKQGYIKNFLDDYVPYYKEAEKKSRRDGLAVLEFRFADGADSVSEPLEGDAEHRGYKLWTVDNFSDQLADSTVAEHTQYNQDQIYISQGTENGGIAIVDDISHEDHGDVIGYGIEPRQESEDIQSVYFLHGSRVQQFVWGEWVDGDIGNDVTGKHVGESVLTPVLQPLKASKMGMWSIKNIFYRYSAPLHAVEPPESWGPDEWENAQENLDNVSMASDAVLPPGTELSVAEGVSEFDPQPIYEVIVEAICAGSVFTKSVLQGTQTGTVSGSETDIKGYFNEVHNLRSQRTFAKFREAVKLVSNHDQQTIPRVANVERFEVSWGPMFKPTDIEKAEGAVSMVTAVTNGIKQYVLTPDEARSILNEKWAEFDVDVDLDELEEEQKDELDRINLHETGMGALNNEPDARQNPRMQNGGGQPSGQTRESSQPTRASADDDELIDAIADRVVEKLSED